jgi:hypothetical protein
MRQADGLALPHVKELLNGTTVEEWNLGVLGSVQNLRNPL